MLHRPPHFCKWTQPKLKYSSKAVTISARVMTYCYFPNPLTLPLSPLLLLWPKTPQCKVSYDSFLCFKYIINWPLWCTVLVTDCSTCPLPDTPLTLKCWLSCHFISLAYLCHLLSSHTCSATYKFPFPSTWRNGLLTSHKRQTLILTVYVQCHPFPWLYIWLWTRVYFYCPILTIVHLIFTPPFQFIIKNKLDNSLSYSSNSSTMNAIPSKFSDNFHAHFLFSLLVPSPTLTLTAGLSMEKICGSSVLRLF